MGITIVKRSLSCQAFSGVRTTPSKMQRIWTVPFDQEREGLFQGCTILKPCPRHQKIRVVFPSPGRLVNFLTKLIFVPFNFIAIPLPWLRIFNILSDIGNCASVLFSGLFWCFSNWIQIAGGVFQKKRVSLHLHSYRNIFTPSLHRYLMPASGGYYNITTVF